MPGPRPAGSPTASSSAVRRRCSPWTSVTARSTSGCAVTAPGAAPRADERPHARAPGPGRPVGRSGPVEVVTADLSFISLTLVVPVLAGSSWTPEGGSGAPGRSPSSRRAGPRCPGAAASSGTPRSGAGPFAASASALEPTPEPASWGPCRPPSPEPPATSSSSCTRWPGPPTAHRARWPSHGRRGRGRRRRARRLTGEATVSTVAIWSAAVPGRGDGAWRPTPPGPLDGTANGLGCSAGRRRGARGPRREGDLARRRPRRRRPGGEPRRRRDVPARRPPDASGRRRAGHRGELRPPRLPRGGRSRPVWRRPSARALAGDVDDRGRARPDGHRGWADVGAGRRPFAPGDAATSGGDRRLDRPERDGGREDRARPHRPPDHRRSTASRSSPTRPTACWWPPPTGSTAYNLSAGGPVVSPRPRAP